MTGNLWLSVLNLLSAIIILNITIYVFKNRRYTGALQYFFLMCAMFIHTFGYAFELQADSLEQVMVWVRIEYIGIGAYPFLLVNFTKAYSDDRSIFSVVLKNVLFFISVTTIVLAFFYEGHNMYYSSLSLDTMGGFTLLNLGKGPWYYIHLIAIYGSVLYSICIYIRIILISKGIYRRRVLLILIGMLIPVISASIYALELIPIPVDLSTLSYSIMSLFMVFGFLKHSALNLVPVTYKRVFEHINEAVIVVDIKGRVIISNEVASKMLGLTKMLKKGTSIKVLTEAIGCAVDFSEKEQFIYHQFEEKIYHLRITDLIDRRELLGYILMYLDVTEAQLAKVRLEELVTKDDLTGIANRRYFLENYLKDLEKYKGEKSLSDVYLAFVDVDFFKQVNDLYGHQMGDCLLKKIAAEISKYFNHEHAYVGRYGGEEFVIAILDRTDSEVLVLLNGLRETVSLCRFTEDNETITISIGFVKSTGDVDEDIKCADEALYLAKERGRNLVVRYCNQNMVSVS